MNSALDQIAQSAKDISTNGVPVKVEITVSFLSVAIVLGATIIGIVAWKIITR